MPRVIKLHRLSLLALLCAPLLALFAGIVWGREAVAAIQTNWASILPWFGGAAALITFGLTAYTIFASARTTHRQKAMDCIAACNARYDDLYKDSCSIRVRVQRERKLFRPNVRKGKRARWGGGRKRRRREMEIESETYANRFWGLKNDQFDYWLAGFVDPDTIVSWMFSTYKRFKKNLAVGTLDFEQSWRRSSKGQVASNPVFVGAIDNLRILAERSLDDRDAVLDVIAILQAIEEKERRFIRHLSHLAFAPRARMEDYRRLYRDGRRSYRIM